MTDTFQTNTKVEWNWGKGTAVGHVREIYRHKVTRKLGGAEVIRIGSKDNPAYLVEQEDGSKVLKLQSELKPVN